MERKIGSAILKGSMLLAAMFLMEGSVYPVQAEEYSTFGYVFSRSFSGCRKRGRNDRGRERSTFAWRENLQVWNRKRIKWKSRENSFQGG